MNVFMYFFGAYKDPEGTEVKLSIMSGLDSSFMLFDEVSRSIVMEPKEAGSHNLYVKLTDGDEEFQIFTLTINILGIEKEEEPEEEV